MKAPVKTVTDRLHSASWYQPIPCEAKTKSVNSQEEPAASIIQAALRAESKAFQTCLQGIVKRMQERRADFPTAFIIHPCTLIRVFTMQPEHMQHATRTIAARCVGNHSTLRMELHRTAGNAPALWSGKTSMMKGFGKERSGYLPSPNKPRTTLMTAGYFREEFLWEARSDIAFIWLRQSQDGISTKGV